jgi:xanthine phosphoribosyltransferase
MKELEERIAQEGRIIDGRIIKVDGFLNHRIDTKLLNRMGEEFYRLFGDLGVTKILTAEASGIAVAVIAAQYFDVPVVFAKKAKSDNIEGGLYASEIYSYTYNRKVTFLVSKQWLCAEDRVLIIDDFLANGEALRGLIDIVALAGAQLMGVGVAVEKGFQEGGKRLRERGINLQSLAIIEGVEDGVFRFRQQ